MPRRSLLIASAATLPLLLGAAGCSSGDLFAGPDPLGAKPPLAHETVVLEAAITAELELISRYKSVMSSMSPRLGGIRGGVLAALLAHHQEHLTQLRARLVVPPGASAPSSSPASAPAAAAGSSAASASGSASSASGPDPIGQLRAAERESATTLVRQLGAVPPALAQLFASIAASDSTHVIALGSL